MMNFLVTSLAAHYVNEFASYFSFQNVTSMQSLSMNGIHFVSFDSPSLFRVYDDHDDLVAFCQSGIDADADAFVRAYHDDTLLTSREVSYGCGLVDFAQNQFVWIGEETGRAPVWFAASSRASELVTRPASFAVSTDVLLLDNVASHSISSFPPGNLFVLTLDTFDVVNVKHTQRFHRQSTLQPPLLTEAEARRALNEALRPYLPVSSQFTFLVEYDPFYYSSRLLLCLLAQLHIPFRVIRTVSTYLDVSAEVFADDAYYQSLLGTVACVGKVRPMDH